MSDIQVKPGYKRTEMGLIPGDWKLISFEELFDFMPTSSCSRGDLSDDGDVYYVHYGDVHTKWDFFLNFQKEYVPKIHSDKVKNAALLKDGDLIMVDASEDEEGVGKSVEVTNLGQEKAVAGLHTLALRPKTSDLANGFKAYIQSMPIVRWQIRRIASGLKVFGVSKEHLKSVLIPVPPLPEQRAIAQVLSDVDAWIEALDRLIAKKRSVKQAAMEDLLTGRARLPGFVKKSGYKRTEVGIIPEDWAVKCLNEIADIDPETLDANTAPNWEFKYIAIEDVERGRLLGYSIQVFKTAPSRARKKITKGDVLLGTIRPNLQSHLFFDLDGDDWVCSTGFSVVRPRGESSIPQYVFYQLFSNMVMRQIDMLLTGSSYPALTSRDVHNLVFPIPSLAEQRAIAKVLSDMDAEIEALERQREKAAAIKQGLMQGLLTGRIRLVQRQSPALRVIKGMRTPKRPAHSWAFNEAVVIATLANRFAEMRHPLGRKRYTKLAYLLHRYADEDVGGYLPKAAGPYNPRTRYAGPEKIAIEKGYVRWHTRGPYEGFVAGEKVAEAEKYFRRWYGLKALQWLDQFRYKTNDELELLTTVDMAVEELKRVGKPITVETVKEFIRNEPEWVPKLERPLFSDDNIARAIKDLERLFDTREE